MGVLPPLDWRGIVVVFLLLSTLVLGLSRVADGLLGLTLWPGMLMLALLMLPLLLRVEARAAQPLIPMSLFAKMCIRDRCSRPWRSIVAVSGMMARAASTAASGAWSSVMGKL